jgi:LPXTG-site transpeptidase (sortase) family protein
MVKKYLASFWAAALWMFAGVASAQTTTATTTPGIPNTGAGDVVTNSVVLAVAALIAVAVFSFAFTRLFLYLPDVEIPAPPEAAVVQADPTEKPVHLRIPILGVDAKVQHVGINDKGNMATPSNFEDVGWYKHGVVPGGRGSAVMAGHVDNGLGLPGVFTRLSELNPGDDIYVESEDGSIQHFVVESKRTYPYADAPVEVIFNQNGSTRLNLITCEGRWVDEDKTYDERLVVFAKLVGT